MSRTITVSDGLYKRLEAEARARGLEGIAQLLEQVYLPGLEQEPPTEEELRRRREAVDHITALQERLSKTYGMMPDSVELIREDRER